jgi:hypothetical protein
LAAQYGKIFCHKKVYTSGLKCLKVAEPMSLMHVGQDAHPHPQAKKNMKSAQVMILENQGVNILKITAKSGR